MYFMNRKMNGLIEGECMNEWMDGWMDIKFITFPCNSKEIY